MRNFDEDSRALLWVVGGDDGDEELRDLFGALLLKVKGEYPDIDSRAEAWGLVAFSQVL